MHTRADLGFALALMNGMWPDLELLPVQERPIERTPSEEPLCFAASGDTVPQATEASTPTS